MDGCVSAWGRRGIEAIKLAAPSRHIRNVLELTNLDSVFEIYPTLPDAALACREQAA